MAGNSNRSLAGSSSLNGTVASGDLFFFYGLLKRGASGMPAHIDLEASGTFLDPAHIGADLYDLNGFPGVVPGKGQVKGLLYRLEDAGLAPHLDAFEDIIPGDPEKSLYYRALTEVLDASGEPDGRLAWVYWFNRSVDGRPQITDGDWPLEACTPQERGTV